MSYKINNIIMPLILLMLSACLDTGNEGNPSKPPASKIVPYGTFLIQLFPEDTMKLDPAYTRVWGSINDGPSIPQYVFKEVMSSGSCKLMKAYTPFCSSGCAIGYKCVADDSCMAEPKVIEGGRVTASGLIGDKKPISAVMDPIKGNYQVVGVALDYPPCAEGDTITLSSEGTDEVDAFTIKARGIAPLEMLNDKIVVEDGKPITLRWIPPHVNGVSTISVQINISHHGGTKGEIHCECEDNGSLTIPGEMLDELKSFGIAGYPRVDVSRKSVGYDEKFKTKVVVECMRTIILTIPGIISCDEPEECPNHQCIDAMCQ